MVRRQDTEVSGVIIGMAHDHYVNALCKKCGVGKVGFYSVGSAEAWAKSHATACGGNDDE